MLFSRLLLFTFFQGLLALLLHSWIESVKYWILTATLTNLVSILLLTLLLRKENTKYLSLFRFNASQWKKDMLLFFGLALLTIPLVFIPSYYLNILFYGGSDYYAELMFQSVSKPLTYFLLVAFPISIAFAELATYFGYLMPRIKAQWKSPVVAVMLPALCLSIQHCTLPLVFELNFILFRGLVYLPFALIIGLSIYKRPSLLTYFAVFHGLLDAMTVVMLLNANSHL